MMFFFYLGTAEIDLEMVLFYCGLVAFLFNALLAATIFFRIKKS